MGQRTDILGCSNNDLRLVLPLSGLGLFFGTS